MRVIVITRRLILDCPFLLFFPSLVGFSSRFYMTLPPFASHFLLYLSTDVSLIFF